MSEARVWIADLKDIHPEGTGMSMIATNQPVVSKIDHDAAMKTLRDERDRLRRDYDELIMAVGNKYPGETRHQTALRYIQRAEEPSNVPAKAALTPAGGGQDE